MLAMTRSSFGDVPNDFEASVDLQYIPVRQGWYYGNPVDGGSYPTMRPAQSRGALGDAATDAAATLKLERLQTFLQVISTVSIAAVATIAVIKAIQGPKRGNDRLFFGDDDDE